MSNGMNNFIRSLVLALSTVPATAAFAASPPAPGEVVMDAYEIDATGHRHDVARRVRIDGVTATDLRSASAASSYRVGLVPRGGATEGQHAFDLALERRDEHGRRQEVHTSVDLSLGHRTVVAVAALPGGGTFTVALTARALPPR
jgi:hypothetical protein